MIIIGDGGHAAVVRELLTMLPGFSTEKNLGHETIIAVGNNAARKREAENAQGHLFATLIHPAAWVSPLATLGGGTVVMAGAVVQPGARIGRHVIVNTCASVDHDCEIGDYAHIAPGAHLCGHVIVGEGALVGVGVGIAPMAVIPAWALVKAARLDIESV